MTTPVGVVPAARAGNGPTRHAWLAQGLAGARVPHGPGGSVISQCFFSQDPTRRARIVADPPT